MAGLELHASSEIGLQSATFGFALTDLPSADIATQSPALVWLDALRAPISGTFKSGLDLDGNLEDFDASLEIGQGVLQPSAATRPIPFQHANAAFRFLRDDALIQFTEIDLQSDLADVSLSGTAALRGLENGWIEDLEGQFSLSGLRLAEGVVFDQEEILTGADLTFKFRPDPFQFTLGELRITDDNYPMNLSGRVSARDDGWHVALDGQVEQTDPETVLKLWPSHRAPRVRSWVDNRVLAGDLTDVVFAVRAQPDVKPEIFLDYDFENARIDYADGFANLTGGAGHFSMLDGRIVVDLDKGEIAARNRIVDVSGSKMVLEDVKKPPARLTLNLQSQGALGAYLDFVDQDRLRILGKAGLSRNVASGQTRLSGTYSTPIRPGLTFEDMQLDLAGVVQNLSSDDLVDGRPLRADRVNVTLRNDLFTASGRGRLSGIGFDGTYRHPIKTGERPSVRAQVNLSDDALRAFGVALPQGMVSGQGTGQFDLRMGQSEHAFSVSSNLSGLALSVPQVGWRKGRNQTGSFTVSGRLGRQVSVDGLQLSAPGLSAQGDVELTSSGRFKALNLSKLAVGSWLDVGFTLLDRGGRAPAIAVSGGRIDLRKSTFPGENASSSGGTSGGDAGPATVALDRLQITDSIWLDRFEATFQSTGGGKRGMFRGRLGGKTPVSGRMEPTASGTAFVIEGEDAGDILDAANIMDNVQDGRFSLSLVPVAGTTGTFDGTVLIRGSRVQNTPTIGALLDAVSIVGILDQVNGPGIYFETIEGKFRLTPDRIIVQNAAAVGPSMGISIDGYYDIQSSRLDMQGVLSPIYILNGIGRLLSARKGEGLIGFNFGLKGTADAPKVQVNPLSVFTPGMFREIFRRPAPKIEN